MKAAFYFFTLTLLQLNCAYAQSIQTEALSEWKTLPEGLHKSIQKAYESPSKKSTLTLREFQVETDTLLKSQVNTWIKDYKSYGFNLKTQKPIKLDNGVKGFFIEAYHKDFDQSFLQFISVEKGKMATLTCKSSEKSELEKCQEALLSFKWNTDKI